MIKILKKLLTNVKTTKEFNANDKIKLILKDEEEINKYVGIVFIYPVIISKKNRISKRSCKEKKMLKIKNYF